MAAAARPGARRRLARGTAQDFLVGTLMGFIVSIVLSQTSTLLASPLAPWEPPKSATHEQQQQQQQLAATTDSSASAVARATPMSGAAPPNLTQILQARYEPKILCAVTFDIDQAIMPGVIRATWGEDCDQGVEFVGPRKDVTNETTRWLQTGSMASNKWEATRALWTLLDPKQAEAVVVASDSSFVVVRNIRHLLRGKPATPRYMGRLSENGPYCMYNAYILTRHAVDTLQAELRKPDSDKLACAKTKLEENGDYRLGQCLASLGIKAETLIDSDGKIQMFLQDPVEFFRKQAAYEHKGPECCTKLPVALFNVGKVSNVRTGLFSELYKFDYLIRRTAVAGLEHLRPYNYEDMPSARQIGF